MELLLRSDVENLEDTFVPSGPRPPTMDWKFPSFVQDEEEQPFELFSDEVLFNRILERFARIVSASTSWKGCADGARMTLKISKIHLCHLVLDLPPWTGNSRHSYKMKNGTNVSSRFSTSFARLSDDFELFSDEVLFNRILVRGLTLRSRSSISAAFPTGRCRHYPSEPFQYSIEFQSMVGGRGPDGTNVSSRFSTSFARLSDDFELFKKKRRKFLHRSP
jgi:hypothetical protein